MGLPKGNYSKPSNDAELMLAGVLVVILIVIVSIAASW